MVRSALLVAFASLAAATAAQEKKDAPDAARQKEAAVANFKKAELGKPTVVETEHFLVVTTLSEEKAKALGAVLEKVVPVARKALQFEAKDEAWKGKLTVYYFPDGREFRAFMRGAVGAQPEGPHIDLKAAGAFVVDPVQLPGKATEADQFASTAGVVAAAFLKARGGTANVPDWLRDGFGRVTAMRAEGVKSKRYLAYQAAARGNVAKNPAKVAELWGETKPMSAELMATSFAEYLAYGPGAANFLKVVSGFRPAENGDTPAVPQALEAAGWKDWNALDAAWRRWVATGK